MAAVPCWGIEAWLRDETKNGSFPPWVGVLFVTRGWAGRLGDGEWLSSSRNFPSIRFGRIGVFPTIATESLDQGRTLEYAYTAMMTLGERIRELRDAKDVSLREFARQIEVTPAHLSDVELGRRFPSEQLLKRIAAKLGVRLEELEKHDSRPPVDEIKRLSEADPDYGFAFRKIVDDAREKKTTGEDFLKDYAKRKPGGKG